MFTLSVNKYLEDHNLYRSFRDIETLLAATSTPHIEKLKYKDINYSTIKIKESFMEQGYKYSISCDNDCDLSQDHIFNTLSLMQSKFIAKSTEYNIQNIKCKMTPIVKRNLLYVHKRMKMFGKNDPFIACFDAFGNPLPDKLQIIDKQGIQVDIIDPKDGDNVYLCLEGDVPIESIDMTPGTSTLEIPDTYTSFFKKS